MKTKQQPTIAITGANGFLGTALVSHFASKGWQVVALVRQPASYHKAKRVTAVAYDLGKPLDDTILKGVDYLVHAAYIKQDKQHPDAFRLNIEAAKHLITAARKNRVKKCLFMSSMSAHDEAVSAYGRQKLAIEKIFKGPDCIAIRAGLIVGKGGIVRQMVEFMRSKHMVPLIGGGKQPLQIVGVYDLVAVIEKVLTSKLSGVFTVATTTVYTYKEFYQTISRHLRIKVLFVPVPFFLLIGIIRLINFLHLPLGVNEDNALGLKKLRYTETAGDLQKIGVKLGSLEEALTKSGY